MEKLQRRKAQRAFKNDIKLARTLLIVFIVFCFSWAPYALICMIDRYDKAPHSAYYFSVLFAHASSSTNSILYAVTNKSFRNGYILFLQRLRQFLKTSKNHVTVVKNVSESVTQKPTWFFFFFISLSFFSYFSLNLSWRKMTLVCFKKKGVS